MRFLFYCLICFTVVGYGQFPTSWTGHYKGTLESYSVSGDTTTYAMELIVKQQHDSLHDWIIVYGTDSLRQERPYRLVWRGDNHYQIDEQNSIELTCQRFGNQFISIFEVKGNLLHVVYTFTGDTVRFELTSANSRNRTGGPEGGDELEIPPVYTYQSGTIQRGLLTKLNDF